MADRRKDQWPKRRADALGLARELVGDVRASLPVNLGKIAARRSVRRVEFKPIFGDGGIAVLDDGFSIYVKCDPGEGEDLTSRFSEDGTGGTLPDKVVRRARFTIAHEIAHTLFYALDARPPRLKISTDSDESAQKLETACNRAAGELLLPELLVASVMHACGRGLLGNLSWLAEAALVSKETVVRRLGQLARTPHPEAIIAYVVWDKNEWRIKAVSKHYGLRGLLTEAREGAPLSRLIDHPDFVPFGGELESVELSVPCAYGKARSMRFTCEPFRRKHDHKSFLLTGEL